MVWDILVTYQAEVEHIWPKPRTSLFKWLFIYLRYFNLFVQIWHQVAISHLTNGEEHTSLCNAWYIWAVVISQASSTVIEVILAVRVFALFNKSRRLACFLVILIAAEVVTMAVNSFHTIPAIPSSDAAVFLVTQSILLGLTIFKHVTAVRSGWGRTPLVSLIIRDSSAVYVVMIVVTGAMFTDWKLQDERTVIMFFWLIAISSVTGCRLIVNMQKLVPAEHRRRRSDAALFTTEIEIGFPSHTTSSLSL
ncbi:hypothetical protein HYDPIDRAFT_31538 [Hydnomerulius pinastri MD-312]|uniref:DUF6533 domain-containing protein n=1 Tax=Hydnomerulius pinastri MD-312 TaxID=994086 RepID=A0A0C9VTF9_9AGAM|nr:hypothetical protein HYDPIDRAFT_31538 [Hydnomerulius pinastri MD-312]